jgi:hypothetical protein
MKEIVFLIMIIVLPVIGFLCLKSPKKIALNLKKFWEEPSQDMEVNNLLIGIVLFVGFISILFPVSFFILVSDFI